MSDEKILEGVEEAPHISLNQDGATIDLGNWNEPANRNWSYRHCDTVLPHTVPISRGDGPVAKLGSRAVDLSGASVHYRGRDMQLDEYLHESHCDAIVVLQGDRIVYENHRRMDADERHLCQSVSKTTVCAVVGQLVAEGLIETSLSVDHYVPGVATGFAGVPVQDLLDMHVALDFSEDLSDPDADIYDYEMLGAWHPDTGGRAGGVLPYLKKLGRREGYDLQGETHYFCPNTDMLAVIAEQVTGQRFTELFQERIYRHLGAEADAGFAVDATGLAIASGGLFLRPRDLARYGRLFADRGVAHDGTRVLPAAWIDDCLDTARGTAYYLGDGFRYHNQMTSNGEALCHLGVGGQMIYANPTTGVVVAQFSTLSMPSNGDLDVGNALYGIAASINELLI